MTGNIFALISFAAYGGLQVMAVVGNIMWACIFAAIQLFTAGAAIYFWRK